MNIPLSKPYWGKEEIKLVSKCIKTTLGIGDGPNTKLLWMLNGSGIQSILRMQRHI